MEVKDIILCSFLVYLTIHMIIDDVLQIIDFVKKYNRQVNLNDVIEDVNRQRTVTTLFSKLCDIVQVSIKQYFMCFIICWCETLKYLNIMVCKYVDFLESLVKMLTTETTFVPACITSVIIISIVFGSILTLYL